MPQMPEASRHDGKIIHWMKKNKKKDEKMTRTNSKLKHMHAM